MSKNMRGQKFITKIKDSGLLRSITHLHILTFLLISGFLINSYIAMKISLWHDETITANAVISFLQNGVPNFPSGYEYWRSLPHTLLTAASGHILGITDYTLRLPSIISSSLTVILTYLAGRKFFDKDIGLIASAFLTFSALQVAWATQVRMYAPLQFLYLLSILLIYRSVEQRRTTDIIGLIFALIIANFVHITSRILPFVAIIYWIYRSNLFNSRYRVKKLGIPLLILGTMIALEFTSAVSFIHIFSRFNFTLENIHHYYELVFKYMPVLTVLGIIGSVLALKKNLKPGLLMIISVFPALFIYLTLVDGVADRYILFSMPFLSIWTALTIKSASIKIKEIIENKGEKEVYLGFIASILTLTLLLVGSGFDYSDEKHRAGMDEKSIYSFIEDNANQSDTLITQWTPPATYYYRSPDYSLYGDNSSRGYNSSYYREEYSYKGVDKYSGAQFIDTNLELIEIITTNDRGWIVLRDTSHRFKSNKIKKTLSELYSAGKFEDFKIWKWNRSVSRSEITSLKNSTT